MGATMKAILSTLLAALALVPAAPAERPVLIELFASQNCKVCPQAYKTLRAVEKAHEGERRHRFTAPRFADDTERFTAFQRET